MEKKFGSVKLVPSPDILIYRKYIENWRDGSYAPNFFYELFIYDIIMGKKIGSVKPVPSPDILIYRKYIENWRDGSYAPNFFMNSIYDIIMGKKFGSITPLTSLDILIYKKYIGKYISIYRAKGLVMINALRLITNWLGWSNLTLDNSWIFLLRKNTIW